MLISGLLQYRTQTPYIKYFFGPKNNLPLPGAGDLLAAVLDVSIVALAIPMFNYRAELKRHVFSLSCLYNVQYIAIILPNLGISVASLFAYPSICALIGIDSSRALAFPARSITLALAIPVVKNLGQSPYYLAYRRWFRSFSGGHSHSQRHNRRPRRLLHP
jgi:hypothetical protein